MLTIELRFPAGRYHATPWDHHVNEGVVEWPPSPWRLLRALVATWHLKARDAADEATLRRLVGTLAEELPAYALPAGTASHTRHFMPLWQPGKTTKVFDTFLHVAEGGSVRVRWPSVELVGELRGLLAELLACVGYLGRAESWAEARLGNGDGTDGALFTTYPLVPGEPVAPNQELVRVLAPLPTGRFGAWREEVLKALLARRLEEKRTRAALSKKKDPERERLTPADERRVGGSLPDDLLDALECDVGGLRRRGWSGVPGASWVDYVRPRDALAPLPARRPRVRPARLPTVARFAVASQVPPRLTEAVSVAERARTALMSRSGGHPVFSGKDEEGKPRRGHAHAFIFPEANGAHGWITHVTLYARMGFDAEARRAMDGLRKVWGRDRHDLQLVLVGVGDPEDFAGCDLVRGHCPLLVQAERWVSRTPFVLTRHRKGRTEAGGLEVGSPEHDLRRLLLEAGFPEPSRIERRGKTLLGGKETRWLAFRTVRVGGAGRRGHEAGVGFLVEFPEPVRGPIAVGYGAHFGLGVFWPWGVGG